MKIQYRDE